MRQKLYLSSLGKKTSGVVDTYNPFLLAIF
jgi:hypothetical protein